MKFKTRLYVTFLTIVLLPLVLTLLAFVGLWTIMSSQETDFGIESGYSVISEPLESLGKSTEDAYNSGWTDGSEDGYHKGYQSGYTDGLEVVAVEVARVSGRMAMIPDIPMLGNQHMIAATRTDLKLVVVRQFTTSINIAILVPAGPTT